eukprot:tig00000042_g15510.t1
MPTAGQRRELGYSVYTGDDGLFWIAWDDFVDHFYKVYICRIFPHDWLGQYVHGEWRGRTAGGGPVKYDASGRPTDEVNPFWAHNRQYHIEVPEAPTTMVITLSQPDARLLLGRRKCDTKIGFVVVRVASRNAPAVQAPTLSNMVAKTSPFFFPGREVSVECTLEPGHYKVVPMAMSPGQESRFTLVIWGERDVELEGERPLEAAFHIGRADADEPPFPFPAPPPTPAYAYALAAPPTPAPATKGGKPAHPGAPVPLRPAASIRRERERRASISPASSAALLGAAAAAAAAAARDRPARGREAAWGDLEDGECSAPPAPAAAARLAPHLLDLDEYEGAAEFDPEPERKVVEAARGAQDLEALARRVEAVEGALQRRLPALEERLAALAIAADAERRLPAAGTAPPALSQIAPAHSAGGDSQHALPYPLPLHPSPYGPPHASPPFGAPSPRVPPPGFTYAPLAGLQALEQRVTGLETILFGRPAAPGGIRSLY